MKSETLLATKYATLQAMFHRTFDARFTADKIVFSLLPVDAAAGNIVVTLRLPTTGQHLYYLGKWIKLLYLTTSGLLDIEEYGVVYMPSMFPGDTEAEAVRSPWRWVPSEVKSIKLTFERTTTNAVGRMKRRVSEVMTAKGIIDAYKWSTIEEEILEGTGRATLIVENQQEGALDVLVQFLRHRTELPRCLGW